MSGNYRHLVVEVLALVSLAAPLAQAGDWPTLQGNPARTGYTDDTVKLPMKVLWRYDAKDEQVSRHVQPIIAESRAYLPTNAGNLHAVDPATGKLIWKQNVGSPIMHSPSCADGLVVVGAYGGAVVALKAADGQQAWRTATEGPVWASPLIYEGKVYVGDRYGVFYAMDLKTGHIAWRYKVASGAPFMLSASAAGGKVICGAEDMVLHAWNAGSGKELWKSEQCGGTGFRSYWPVIAGDKVLVGTMRGQAYNHGVILDNDFLSSQSKLVKTRWQSSGAGDGEAKQPPHEQLQPFIIDYLSKNKSSQTLYFLKLSDGTSAGIPPALQVAGHGTAYNPPAVHKDGKIYLLFALTRQGESQPVALGWVDFTPEGIRFHELCRGNSTRPGAGGLFVGFSVTDISQLICIGGDMIYGVGASLGAFDIKASQPLSVGMENVEGASPPYEVFRLNGGTVAPPAIADNKLFLVRGCSLVCLGSQSK